MRVCCNLSENGLLGNVTDDFNQTIIRLPYVCRVMFWWRCKSLHQLRPKTAMRRQARLPRWWNPSITHIPCESVSACGRKREGATQTGREGKKECTEISSCALCFFFLFFFIAARWLHVCRLGLLARFSELSRHSVSLASFVLSNSIFSLDFFLSSVTCERSSCPCFMQCSLEGKRRTHGETDICFDLSKGRWVEGINKRSRFGLSVCAVSSQGSQTKRRKVVGKGWEKVRSDCRGRDRRSCPILWTVGIGESEVGVEESDTGGGAAAWGRPPVQPSSSNTRQDEVPSQGKFLTGMMLFVVFSCLVHYLCLCNAQDPPVYPLSQKEKQNSASLEGFFCICMSQCVFWFCISFNPSWPERINLVTFHHIHYWYISSRKPAVVPVQPSLGQCGGACLIWKTIRMESAQ